MGLVEPIYQELQRVQAAHEKAEREDTPSALVAEHDAVKVFLGAVAAQRDEAVVNEDTSVRRNLAHLETMLSVPNDVQRENIRTALRESYRDGRDAFVICDECSVIQSNDSLRHFKGCSKRAPLPEGHPMQARGSIDVVTAAELAPPKSPGLGIGVSVTPDGCLKVDVEVDDIEHEKVCGAEMSRAFADAIVARQGHGAADGCPVSDEILDEIRKTRICRTGSELWMLYPWLVDQVRENVRLYRKILDPPEADVSRTVRRELKFTPEEDALLRALADEYTNGNVSRWIREQSLRASQNRP